jgi:hypothetical protein
MLVSSLFYGYGAALALPFTHRICTTKLAAPEGEPFTHEPQHRITLPHQLVPRGRVTSAPKIASHSCYQAHRVSQLLRQLEVFFFA